MVMTNLPAFAGVVTNKTTSFVIVRHRAKEFQIHHVLSNKI